MVINFFQPIVGRGSSVKVKAKTPNLAVKKNLNHLNLELDQLKVFVPACIRLVYLA